MEKEATCGLAKRMAASSAMIDRHGSAVVASRIRRYICHAPLLRASVDNFSTEPAVALKLERLQHSGSFKPRGAFNRVLTARVLAACAVAACYVGRPARGCS
ncbi:PALP domain-containing protein [Rhodopila globiformis]|uniref:hypothetical protein n=1 Tax=Rhodopila globiformis TaxID=1071 RepID=UPI001473C267|nr:hypothetical protein [Rhodopila globiformis]